jgi:hypothetical protein
MKTATNPQSTNKSSKDKRQHPVASHALLVTQRPQTLDAARRQVVDQPGMSDDALRGFSRRRRQASGRSNLRAPNSL